MDWSLEEEIELLREEMIYIANNKGLIADGTMGSAESLISHKSVRRIKERIAQIKGVGHENQ